MKGWDHVTHLTELEKRCASLWLKPIDPSQIKGPPTGLIVGECPGKSTSSKLAMFPWPKASSGGRLFKMANMPIEIYLGSLRRCNVFYDHQEKWWPWSAHENALGIHLGCEPYTRVVLCGKRVASAFGFDRYFEVGSIPHQQKGGVVLYCTIPHPSGLNREYNNPLAVQGAEMALHWAAGYNIVHKEPANAD